MRANVNYETKAPDMMLINPSDIGLSFLLGFASATLIIGSLIFYFKLFEGLFGWMFI